MTMRSRLGSAWTGLEAAARAVVARLARVGGRTAGALGLTALVPASDGASVFAVRGAGLLRAGFGEGRGAGSSGFVRFFEGIYL